VAKHGKRIGQRTTRVCRDALSEVETSTGHRDGQRDFDFLFGAWTVHHRRIKHPLSGSSEWYEFDGTSVERPIWGGRANLEEQDLDSPLGFFQGLALRLYDEKAAKWSIYWGTAADGLTTIPVVGSFTASGVGEFFSHEEYESKNIIVRFLWSHESIDRCRWEQAFSVDGGTTWESNWTMDFRRIARTGSSKRADEGSDC